MDRLKTNLNIKAIARGGNDLIWCKLNDLWHGAILNVKEIMQLYFVNLEKIKSCDKKEWVTDDSIDDDEQSCKYHSNSEDSTDMEYDDVYDFDCNDDAYS